MPATLNWLRYIMGTNNSLSIQSIKSNLWTLLSLVDKLIFEAVKLIYQSKGTIRIKELNEKLFISQSPFEKRFRKIVGTSAKKFASIIRFNSVLDNLNKAKSLTEICYENNFFYQAHFIKDFKQFTGNTQENFKRSLSKNVFLQLQVHSSSHLCIVIQ